jgi:hypothetical protein
MIMKCKEYLCNGNVPEVKKGALTTQRQIEAFACRQLQMCRYCYRYLIQPPARKMWNLPENRHGSEKVFTPSDRRHIERSQFEYMEIFLWEPEFYYEWLDAFYD